MRDGASANTIHTEHKYYKHSVTEYAIVHTSSSLLLSTTSSSFFAAEFVGSIFNNVSKSTILSSYRCSICNAPQQSNVHLYNCENISRGKGHQSTLFYLPYQMHSNMYIVQKPTQYMYTIMTILTCTFFNLITNCTGWPTISPSIRVHTTKSLTHFPGLSR